MKPTIVAVPPAGPGALLRRALALPLLMLALQGECAGAAERPRIAGAANVDALLEELIETALRQDPGVLAQRSQAAAAQEDLAVARMQRLPALTVQSEAANKSPTTTLSVKQVLWAGGRIDEKIAASSATFEARRAQVRAVQYQAAQRVIGAWQALQQARGRIEVIGATQIALERYRGLMQRRVESQVSPQVELDLLEARALQATVDMGAAASAARSAQAALEILLGGPRATAYLAGAMTQQEQVAQVGTLLPADLAELIDAAEEVHPTVRQARLESEAAKRDAAAQRAARWPEVYAGLQRSVGRYAPSSTTSLYVGLQYAPGAGFSSLAQARAASARAEGADQAVVVAKHTLRDAMQTDAESLVSASARAEALLRSDRATWAVLESYERQFTAGRRGWQEVLNALRENSDIRTALVDARAGLVGAAFRLRVAAGQMYWQNHSIEEVAQ